MSDITNFPDQDMTRLAAEIRAVATRLSCDQILDLADVLHEVIRERQARERAGRRIEAHMAATEAH